MPAGVLPTSPYVPYLMFSANSKKILGWRWKCTLPSNMRKWYLTKTSYEPYKSFASSAVGITTVGILRQPTLYVMCPLSSYNFAIRNTRNIFGNNSRVLQFTDKIEIHTVLVNSIWMSTMILISLSENP